MEVVVLKCLFIIKFLSSFSFGTSAGLMVYSKLKSNKIEPKRKEC